MKYKKLTKEEIIIAIDRLTRFKNTREKYIRVYSDIINEGLIEPKIRKNGIEDTDFDQLSRIVSEIINNSLGCGSSDGRINNILEEYENSVYDCDYETKKLLKNSINYSEAAKIFPENLPVNLKWIKYLTKNSQKESSIKGLEDIRNKYALKFPVNKVILAEGITEEVLLPAFCRFLGYDFYEKGVHIIAAGGKNQVVKIYYKLCEELKIPIYILLDKDAEENINQIKPKLREIDKIHLVSCGEFEDMLPHSLVIKTVNAQFKNFLTITEEDLSAEESMAKILEELFKKKGLHEFKKAEFAKLVRENINDASDISTEIREIVKEITN